MIRVRDFPHGEVSVEVAKSAQWNLGLTKHRKIVSPLSVTCRQTRSKLSRHKLINKCKHKKCFPQNTQKADKQAERCHLLVQGTFLQGVFLWRLTRLVVTKPLQEHTQLTQSTLQKYHQTWKFYVSITHWDKTKLNWTDKLTNGQAGQAHWLMHMLLQCITACPLVSSSKTKPCQFSSVTLLCVHLKDDITMTSLRCL